MRDVVLVERQEVSGLRWNEVRNQIPEGLGEMGTKGNNVEGRLEWQESITSHLLGKKLEAEPLVSPKVGV